MEYFPGQRPDEDVLILTRPHWLTLLPATVVTSLLAIVPIVFFVAVPVAGFEITGLGGAIATAVTSGYFLALVTYYFIRWIDFYLDVAIVTSDRIVDIDQHGLFRRTVDELDCKMIQDVSATKHGILQTLFNFGTVEIQTAGERRNFEFKGVPKPDYVQELVAKAQGMGETAEHQSSAKEHAEAAAKEAAAAQAKQATGSAGGSTKTAAPAEKAPKADTPRHPDSQDLPREFE